MAGEIVSVGSLADLGFVREDVFGVVPASPQLEVFRRLNTSLNLTKEIYRSAELRRNRIPRGARHGVRRVAGDIQTEFGVAMYDTALEALMGGTWTAGVEADQTALTSVTADGADNKFVFAGGDPVALGFKVGDIVAFSGLATAANNARFTIRGFQGASNREMLVAEQVVTDAVPDNAFTLAVVGSKLKIGNIYRSFAFERAFTDVGRFQVYTGCRFNSLRLQLPPTGFVSATWSLIGQDAKDMSPLSLDPSYLEAPDNDPVTSNDGELFENGQLMGLVTGLELTIDNQMGGKPTVGRRTIANVLYGNMQQVTGRMTVLFTDEVMYNKFVQETPSSLTFRMDDPVTGDFVKLHIPRLIYTSGDIGDADPAGNEVTMGFEVDDPIGEDQDASTVVWQRSNA